MSFLIMLYSTCAGPFSRVISCIRVLDFGPRKKYPPALFRASGSDMRDASEYMRRIVALLLYFLLLGLDGSLCNLKIKWYFLQFYISLCMYHIQWVKWYKYCRVYGSIIIPEFYNNFLESFLINFIQFFCWCFLWKYNFFSEIDGLCLGVWWILWSVGFLVFEGMYCCKYISWYRKLVRAFFIVPLMCYPNLQFSFPVCGHFEIIF